MFLTSTVQASIFLQLFSKVLCQFPPMQFPFPQMGQQHPMAQPNMAPMAPIPPLAPQPMYPPQMPMGFPMHQPHKMPSVVMPYYSKSANRPGRRYRRKRRRPRRFEESVETRDSSESESGQSFDFRRKGSKRRRQVLTPVVSYVTKDGYVVYQKKIKKEKAKDWLEMTKNFKESKEEHFTSEEERKFQKMLKYKKKKLLKESR